jgi:uncharacterized protein YjiS (DUF1127 family)
MAKRDTIGTIWTMPTFGVPRAVRLLAEIEGWMALRRSRHALLRLDDRLLRDVGLTRADAIAEARRSDVIED